MKPLILLLACSLSAADLGVISERHGISLNKETSRPDFSHFIAEFKPDHTTNTITLTITNDLILLDDLVRLPSGRNIMGLKSVFADGSESKMSVYTFDLRRADPPAPSAERIWVSTPTNLPKSLINELERIRSAAVPPTPPMPMVDLPNLTNDWVRPSSIRGHVETPSAPPIPLDDLNGYAEAEILIGTNRAMFFRAVPVEQIEANSNISPELLVQELQRITGSNVVLTPPPLPNSTNQSYAEYLDWLADRKGKRRSE